MARPVQRSFADSQKATAAVIKEAGNPLGAFVDWYVSAEHRDNPGSGCSVIALGGEAARSDPRVRAAYTDQVKRYLAQLEQLLSGAGEDPDALAHTGLRAREDDMDLERKLERSVDLVGP